MDVDPAQATIEVMSRSCYTFFDRTLILALPPWLQEQWDHLYGRFHTPGVSSANAVSIAWESRGSEVGRLFIGFEGRDVAGRDAMMYLQDYLQNTILSAVQSHLLWHGAAWRIDGHGILLLGASGLGKSTLSLAEILDGGCVLSDEIAAWEPVTSKLVAFPRALAVRPDCLGLLDDRRPHMRLRIDEEKAVIPCAMAPDPVPLKAVCILEWPMDNTVGATEAVCEFQVLAATQQWVARLTKAVSPLVLRPHPDGGNWWRCHTPDLLRLDRLEQVLREEQATLMDWHRGARRRPSFLGDPQPIVVDCDVAAEMALACLINARTWVAAGGAPKVLGMVRAALRKARCVRCVPGALTATRRLLHGLVRAA